MNQRFATGEIYIYIYTLESLFRFQYILFLSFFNIHFSVTYGNKDAMGAGKSKKEAKHQAARNLIDKLTGVQIADQILPPSNGNKEYVTSDYNNIIIICTV